MSVEVVADFFARNADLSICANDFSWIRGSSRARIFLTGGNQHNRKDENERELLENWLMGSVTEPWEAVISFCVLNHVYGELGCALVIS